MTQVDFYILAENSRREINQMVCLLCEKALAQAMNVLIYTHSSTQAQQLDDLLWTFKNDSFIPHKNQFRESHIDDSHFYYPVLICHSNNTRPDILAQYKQLLINLSNESPAFISQFKRTAELVDSNDEEKKIARNRYRYYQQKGYTLNTYDL